MYPTQKSHKSGLRDKPKHSDKLLTSSSVPKKGGGGGKGTWGSYKDDVRYADEDGHAVDEGDPNYDPAEEKGYLLKRYNPAPEVDRFFANTMRDLTLFKKKVRSACEEYISSLDATEFIKSVQGLEFSLYHQDLPAILIKYALDRSDSDRQHISSLLHAMVKENLLTSAQMTKGFRKLFNVIDELAVDAPNARVILFEFVGHGRAAGYLESEAMATMENEAVYLSEPEKLARSKKAIKDIVEEYFVSADVDELVRAVKEIPPATTFEVIKQMGNTALDRGDAERERANVGFAALVGGAVSADQMAKGFTILLSRVEDIYLDVPDVLRLLSRMVARAVSDEALPPAFLLRLDLHEGDLGFQVAKEAQHLLGQPGAVQFLENVWGQAKEDEDYCHDLGCYNRLPCPDHD